MRVTIFSNLQCLTKFVIEDFMTRVPAACECKIRVMQNSEGRPAGKDTVTYAGQ